MNDIVQFLDKKIDANAGEMSSTESLKINTNQEPFEATQSN